MIAESGVTTDKKGVHTFNLKAKGGHTEIVTVEHGALPAVLELVAQAQQAMENYR